MSLFFYAILAGFLSIITPSFLPFVPVFFCRRRSTTFPLLFLGIFVSFAVIGSFVITLGPFLGVTTWWLRVIGVVITGLAFLFPFRADGTDGAKKSVVQGSLSLLYGLGIGLLFVPCVGPLFSSLLLLGVTSQAVFTTFIFLSAYLFGAYLPFILLFRLTGDAVVLLERIPFFQMNLSKIMTGLLLLTLAFFLFQGDLWVRTVVLTWFPIGLLPL